MALTFSRFSFATLSIDDPHGYTWKYGLQVADKSAAADNAPLLICSDLPESNFEPMPADVYAATDGDFAPIFYYKVHSRVVPLPRALNAEAMAQINKFLGHRDARQAAVPGSSAIFPPSQPSTGLRREPRMPTWRRTWGPRTESR